MRSSWRRSSSPLKRGFTLVELLVVIGIIAVLISILLPVMSKVQEQSRRTNCLSNLRNLGQAMIMYANDYKDRLPNTNPAGGPTNDSASASYVLIALNDKYVKDPAVFHCPSDADPIPSSIATADEFAPNSARVSYDFYSLWWAPEHGPKLSKLGPNAKATGKQDNPAPLAWDLDGGQPTRAPDQNHGTKGGNVVYADGHGEWQPQKQWDDENWPHPANAFYLGG